MLKYKYLLKSIEEMIRAVEFEKKQTVEIADKLIMNAKLYKQKGKGKGDAVILGFSKANKELLLVLDADLTVDPKELPKFYEAVAEGKGDLIDGTRLVYPMEAQAMRSLNYCIFIIYINQ